MNTAAEYRAMAEECFKWAREAKSERSARVLAATGPAWLDAASELDGLPATRLAITPGDSPKAAA
jgi:hypothetical protein